MSVERLAWKQRNQGECLLGGQGCGGHGSHSAGEEGEVGQLHGGNVTEGGWEMELVLESWLESNFVLILLMVLRGCSGQ